ncbi:tubulin-specific chaperone A [Eurytemora carolleeae]|uniref:tubulin-specific chaperone A n=1 Tax=Eurytemora carolleeae TaxID=1294199 RepID=UPI000C76E590|nr:tubulin-specific chaperone A [Eurytemora carolleeae]|eukprot:XP_023326995.1 tubulin-specific chaperone A-like [Eurytemora affinis]
MQDNIFRNKMSDPKLKQIKIKTGVLKRIGKEKLSYRKEADQQKAKLEKMKEEGKDSHDIKKMGEVVQESLMMIPDCHRRLITAHADLMSLLEQEKDLAETEKYVAAQAQIQEAEEQMKAE